MSFNINPPSRNLSNVQASQGSCPGGGGNTGYFQRGSKEDDLDLKFAKDYPSDSFELLGIKEEDEEGFFEFIISFFKELFNKIKSLFIKTKTV